MNYRAAFLVIVIMLSFFANAEEDEPDIQSENTVELNKNKLRVFGDILAVVYSLSKSIETGVDDLPTIEGFHYTIEQDESDPRKSGISNS